MRPVIFINRTYWPNEQATAQLLTDLAAGLAASGRQVSVLTSVVPGRPAREEHRGVSIFRVGSSLRSRRRGLLNQARTFLTFALAARRWVTAHLRPGAQVVILSDPPLIGASLLTLLQQQSAVCHHWIHDIYPEIAMDRLRLPGLKWLQPWRDRAWLHADTCVTVSESMATVIRSRGVPANRVRVLSNWAPQQVEPPDPRAVAAWRQDNGLSGGFIVGYSGNLGRVHTFETLVAAADLLRNDARFRFVFIGDGAQRSAVERDLARRKLKTVRFLPSQPREVLPVALSAIDLHLVCQRPGCEAWVFPSKLYGIAAVGRPVLSIGSPDAEFGRLVVQNRFGWHHATTDVEGVAATLRDFAGSSSRREEAATAAREFHRTAGGFERALADWSALLGARDSRPPTGPV
ncbi:MAG: glycosyltransferase family 4 protein [Opitutaceae bacterium]|jgi:colanic acid biosynthesis glycosyl transferase WcaI|nr:glycosyltransferase family 4 protein [Opitutaceae bacterium]